MCRFMKRLLAHMRLHREQAWCNNILALVCIPALNGTRGLCYPAGGRMSRHVAEHDLFALEVFWHRFWASV